MADEATAARLHCVILAAGASRRLGRPKSLLPAGGGTLLELVAGRAGRVFGKRITVVLGADADKLRPLLDKLATRYVLNERWPEGMAASIRCGMADVPAGADAVLLMPVDQPLVRAADLAKLATAWQHSPESLAAAAYSGTVGIPAVFPRRVFDALATLTGDTGARGILREERDRLIAVPLPEAAFDVDTEDDVRRFLAAGSEGTAMRTKDS